MRQLYFSFLILGSLFLRAAISNVAFSSDHTPLAIGKKAPDFKLRGVDGKMYSLSSFNNSKILVIVFTCDHCPTAQAYEERLIRLTKDYSSRGVAVVAIMPNNPKSVQLNELGYADVGDSFEEMKLHAKRKHFNFPYLFDGDHETVAEAYGPVATPHIFIFDKERILRYQGRIDDVEKPTGVPKNLDTKNAIEALLAGKEVTVKTTKVFGCSIKWAEKEDLVAKSDKEWAAEPVTLDTIDEAGVKDLLKNNSDKLRLINVWATWCGPCVNELPSFVTINRMYRKRDFEFITISADNPEKKDKVLKALKNLQAANTNYLFSIDDKYKLIEAVDPNWNGALPYTVLVEPGGKIVYGKQGTIDPMEMKTMIVENKLIGRFY
ncbi:MAG: redoxin domain-containing protein [Ginsengibacter sp.]